MTIAEIIGHLPKDDAELSSVTTPQDNEEPCRHRLFEAHALLEKLYHQTRRSDLLDVLDLLPADPSHFEQIISTAQGQDVIRERVSRARELLKIVEVKAS